MNEPERDRLAELAVAEMVASCGGPKRIGAAAGRHKRTAYRWVNGCRSNPQYRLSEAIMESARDPWPMAVGPLTLAVLREIQEDGPLTEAKVQERWAEIDTAEQEADCAEDVVQTRFHHQAATVRGMLGASKTHLARAARRTAILTICQIMGWDPRPEGGR